MQSLAAWQAFSFNPSLTAERQFQKAKTLTVQITEEFRQAARNAMDAGFDGIEIHGANVGIQFGLDFCT